MRRIAGLMACLMLVSSAASAQGDSPPADGPLLERISPRLAVVPNLEEPDADRRGDAVLPRPSTPGTVVQPLPVLPARPAAVPHPVPPAPAPPLEVAPLVYRRVIAEQPPQPPVHLMPAVVFSGKSRVEHLLEAACHLDAAGLADDAERIRELAQGEERAEQERRLERKLAELEALQEEIDHLRRQTGRPQQIRIDVRMLEIRPDGIRAAGLAHPAGCPCQGIPGSARSSVAAGGKSPAETGGGRVVGASAVDAPSALTGAAPFCAAVLQDQALLARHLDDLRRRGLLKVLAEPSLMAIDGRPARVASGGEFPVPTGDGRAEMRAFGIRMEARAVPLGRGRIRLELQPEYSERDVTEAVEIAGQTVAGLKSWRLDTAVELEAGQTVLLGGGGQTVLLGSGVSRSQAPAKPRGPKDDPVRPAHGADDVHDQGRMLVLLVTAVPVAPEGANAPSEPLVPVPSDVP